MNSSAASAPAAAEGRQAGPPQLGSAPQEEPQAALSSPAQAQETRYVGPSLVIYARSSTLPRIPERGGSPAADLSPWGATFPPKPSRGGSERTLNRAPETPRNAARLLAV